MTVANRNVSDNRVAPRPWTAEGPEFYCGADWVTLRDARGREVCRVPLGVGDWDEATRDADGNVLPGPRVTAICAAILAAANAPTAVAR